MMETVRKECNLRKLVFIHLSEEEAVTTWVKIVPYLLLKGNTTCIK
jgi:hypothetical protein